jgi:hypothetical protein
MSSIYPEMLPSYGIGRGRALEFDIALYVPGAKTIDSAIAVFKPSAAKRNRAMIAPAPQAKGKLLPFQRILDTWNDFYNVLLKNLL